VTEEEFYGWCDAHIRSRQLSNMKKMEGHTYLCMEDFVLDQGHRCLSGEPENTETRLSVRRAIADAGPQPMMACYDNAQRLVLEAPSLFTYHEGIAGGKACIPVMHAWVTIQENCIVDPTWQRENNPWDIPEAWFYWGVPFPLSAVVKARKQKEISIIDDWHNHWPVLKWPRKGAEYGTTGES
tara:strand:+ start:431 stop:979 length:549 start_codon:yes stop_codon:yes gene_type:complete